MSEAIKPSRCIVPGDRHANIMAVCIMTRVMDRAIDNIQLQPTAFVDGIQAIIEGTLEHMRDGATGSPMD